MKWCNYAFYREQNAILYARRVASCWWWPHTLCVCVWVQYSTDGGSTVVYGVCGTHSVASPRSVHIHSNTYTLIARLLLLMRTCVSLFTTRLLPILFCAPSFPYRQTKTSLFNCQKQATETVYYRVWSRLETNQINLLYIN